MRHDETTPETPRPPEAAPALPSAAALLRQARPALEALAKGVRDGFTLFFSITTGRERAHVVIARGADLDAAWAAGAREVEAWSDRLGPSARWLRVDVVNTVHAMRWEDLKAQLRRTKRNYFRCGIALDSGFSIAMLEQELGANALLYDNAFDEAVPNAVNLERYGQRRFGRAVKWPEAPDQTVWLFDTLAVFADGEKVHEIEPEGRYGGFRRVTRWNAGFVRGVVEASTAYLAAQVKPSGEYHYGWFPCFDRAIPTYNALRHASSTYALLEGWELTREPGQLTAAELALAHLAGTFIHSVTLPDGDEAAFLVDTGNEIKLGGNAVCILALVKHAELTGDLRHLALAQRLARGILHMQDAATGRFVHVLNHPDLSIREANRIIYYEGEAAFGLMRLYGLTQDARYLQAVGKAFDYFIAAEHWRAHDHWLSYCVNELTLHRPEARYYRFGLDNVRDHLDFVLERITTFPTLLELMMAAQKMIERMQADPAHAALLEGFDLGKFERALEVRARYLLTGHFWPELAMFFKNPQRIAGSFFIRHHGYRVRIDDIEHYLSGYAAYLAHLRSREPLGRKGPVVLWGGDVNIGRRQHYRASELGKDQVLAPVRAIARADLSIVNLECVVAVGGRRAVAKGEGAPYYFRARPEMLEVLTTAGVDLVVTANNHSGDYGPGALMEQLGWLDAVGLKQAGSGADLEAALAPAVLPAGEFEVAVFSLDATQPRFAAGPASPGSAHLPLDDPRRWTDCLAPRIARARERAHVVLVAVHWGANHAPRPEAAKSAVGRAIIDAGADAVLGSSAHVLQGIELHRGRPILHDAGDLLFDARRTDNGDGGVFELEIGAHGVERVVFVPVSVGFGQSAERRGAQAMTAVEAYAGRCAELGVALQRLPNGTGVVELAPAPRAQATARVAADRRPPQRHDLRPLHAPRPMPPGAARDAVPTEALLPVPLHLGPLTLLGVQVRPRETVTRRRCIWVESFWTCEAPVSEDFRLDIRAQHTTLPSAVPWGLGMDHDPCDWLVPTRQWRPGTIHRDCCPLRPPEARDWTDGTLQLEVALMLRRERLHVQRLPVFFELARQDADALARAIAAIDGEEQPQYRTDFPAEAFAAAEGQTWNAQQLSHLTGGTWLVEPPPGWSVRSVVSGASHIAMRTGPTLYVAHDTLDRYRHERGKAPVAHNVDRHALLPRLASNIAGAIVSKPVMGVPADLPLLQVEDPIRAIVELGVAARARFRGEVIAVTGTVGKSTTLGLLSHALGGPERVLSSVDNYNSRVGAPSTLASLSPEHEAAVVEIAQSALWMKRGPVTRLVRPTIALITAIGFSQTHSMVRSIEDVVRWKTRVFDGLCGQAVAIVGEHLPHFDAVLARARQHARRCIVFGSSLAAEVRLLNVRRNAYGSWVEIATPKETAAFYVPLPGEGMVHNALAVAAVLHAMGRDLESGLARLSGFASEEGRLQWHTLSWDGIQAQVLDDSWNAEVESMRNAFSVLALGHRRRRSGRKVAVLGRIVHLGDMARPLHESLAEPLVASGAELVVTHGEEMQYLRSVLPSSLLGPHFGSAEELVRYLRRELRDGDTVLLKGSRRNSDFGETFPKLRALATPAGPSVSSMPT